MPNHLNISNYKCALASKTKRRMSVINPSLQTESKYSSALEPKSILKKAQTSSTFKSTVKFSADVRENCEGVLNPLISAWNVDQVVDSYKGNSFASG